MSIGQRKDSDEDEVRIPQRPGGGWIGEVRVRAAASASLALPLRLRVLYSQVLRRDLLPAPKSKEKPKYFWHQPSHVLDRAAPVRVVRYTEEMPLLADPKGGMPASALVLPVINCRDTSAFLEDDGSATFLMSVRAEVSDANGRLLDRRLLVEACDTSHRDRGKEAWVTEDDEADRVLRERCRIQSMSSVDRLPPVVAPYVDVDVLWISAKAWERYPLDTTLLRRLFLIGRWIYGRPATVEVVAKAAGLDRPQPVLSGGVGAPAGTKEEAHAGDDHDGHEWRHSSTTLADFCAPCSKTNAVPVLENGGGLFDAHRPRFLHWTLGALGIFCVLVAVGLPLAFYRLKGARRLVLWWVAPGVSVVCGLASWWGGNWMLPRGVQTDVTEFRLAYAPWPEVCCQSIGRALNFEQPALAWQMSADSVVLPSGAWAAAFKATYVTRAVEGGCIQFSGLHRGNIETVEVLGFRELPLPVDVEWRDNKPWLKSRQALRKVHVWHEGVVGEVGAMAAGATVDVSGSRTTESLDGLPHRLGVMLNSLGLRPTCCDKHKAAFDRKLKTDGVQKNTWVVVALSDEAPAFRPATPAASKGRVAWIIQLPLKQPSEQGARRGPG